MRNYAAQIYARRQIVLVDRLRERSVKMQTTQIIILACAGLGMFALLGLVTFLSSHYNLDGIKSKTVGDGQYGTDRKSTRLNSSH